MRAAVRQAIFSDPIDQWARGSIHAWDFLNGTARFNYQRIGRATSTPGLSFTRASTAYATDLGGSLVSFASGQLRRIDGKGVLIEGARTNLCTYSQDWTDSSWTKTNATVTAAATTAPDGTTTATQLAATTSAATTVVKNCGAVAATAASYSIYVKKGSGATDANAFILRNLTTATILVNGTINYDTGAWTTTTGNAAIVSTLGNGWYRITLYATSGITSGDSIQVYVGFTGNSETASEYAYFWGAQLEAASFPSSYIPTTTASATRAADVLTVPVSGVDYPLSLYAEWQWLAPSAAASRCAVQININGSDANRAYLRVSSNDTVRAVMTSGGVEQGAVNPGVTSVSGGIYKHAGRFALNDVNCALNGTVGSADTSASLPSTPTTIRFGAVDTANGEPLFGYLRRAALWTRALADGELQGLTT